MHYCDSFEKNTNHRIKRYRRCLIILLICALIGIIGYSYYMVTSAIPRHVRILVGRPQSFCYNLPMEACIKSDEISVSQSKIKPIEESEINIDLSEPFSISSNTKGSYEVALKLFGFIELKTINLDVIDTIEVIPCGGTIGITINTDGLLVLGTANVKAKDGQSYDPSMNLLKSGDYIIKINDTKLTSKEQFVHELQKVKDQPANLTIKRKNQECTVSVTPIMDIQGIYKIGAWIRDDTQGIGTLTFITTTGQFGALGHGITDVDTGLLMNVGEGSIYEAEVVSIIKGKSGTPGELSGIIHESKSKNLGEIKENTVQGIFGQVNEDNDILSIAGNNIYKESIPIGLKQDMKVGPASILCNIDGVIKEYDILIENVDLGNSENKGIVIKITDEELKEKTGGIVQGMSGSPIIQDGKIVGAVTHVFIRDSTMGYGTFIENMIQNLQ